MFAQNRRAPNPEGSKVFQIRRGPSPEGSCLHKTGGVPIRRGLIFTISEGSQSGGVLYLLTQRAPNPEGSKVFQIRRGPSPERSCLHKTGGVPIRRGLIFTISEGSQSGGVLYLLTQRGPNPEGSKFCQSGRVHFCQSGGVLFYYRT